MRHARERVWPIRNYQNFGKLFNVGLLWDFLFQVKIISSIVPVLETSCKEAQQQTVLVPLF